MTEELTVASARLAKATLERSIQSLLQAFTEHTGVRVDDLSVSAIDMTTLGGKVAMSYHVSIQIKL